MNSEEREQLAQFLQQLTQAQPTQKDSEAEALIREACLRQPDAAYLLVQRAMLLNQALQDSQTQITRLNEQLNQTRNSTSSGRFIDPNAWGNTTALAARTTANPPPPPLTMVPTPAATPSAWGAGMLGSIATTAAGVVAGGFLFQGISHLLGNQGTNSGTMNHLNSKPLPDQNEATVGKPNIDDSTNNAGVFDTSSLDSLIAEDSGGSDEIG